MIRLATFQDIPELKRLLDFSVRGLSNEYYTSSQIESALKYIFGIDTQLISDGTYYIVETDGVITGCGGWSMRNTLYGVINIRNWKPATRPQDRCCEN